ncbi:acyltransferase family protein [Luethyella okanaganae]|uniref:Acyltransferase n=1 Tax=Luethyella okanaganae TaxID=69372 RepID=A0ABW1VEJ8_9MICO
MNSGSTPPSTGSVPETDAARDPVMDLVRVLCVVLVIVAHLLMIGAVIEPGVGLVIRRPLLEQSWLAPVTWIAQIMPLFFVVGGFAGIGAWTRLETSGGTASEFIRARLLRLARPAVPLFAFFTVGIFVLYLTGVAPSSVAAMAAGVASPLWFLAAYTFAQAYLPGMATLHKNRPLGTLLTLAGCAVAIDALRFASGIEVLGLLNMIFVWLFVQQLGFWVADGWFARRSRWTILGIGAGSYLLLFLLVTSGYPENMLDNLNPPTVAILSLAIGQTCLLVLAHPALALLMRSRILRRIVGIVGGHLMTLYLWHLPVLALVIGLLLLTPLPTPQPGSVAWWWTRPLILACAALALGGLARLLGRFEQPMPSHDEDGRLIKTSNWSVGLSASLMVIPPFTVMLFGLDFAIAVVSTALLAVAVAVQKPIAAPEPDTGASAIAS